MKHRPVFSMLAFAVVLSVLLMVPPTASAQSGISNGAFSVAVLRDGTWQPVGPLAFGQDLTEQRIDLSGWVSAGQVTVRLVNPGSTAAHIDAVRLGSVAPRAVSGTAEETSLALKKLTSRDYDVIDASHRTLTLTFDLPLGEIAFLALTARIEPELNPVVPFEFPTSNLYRAVDSTSQFYSYRLNSVPGSLQMNGDLSSENLGEPFFKEWSQPITGHPSNFTYGWVRNDASNLYVAIDFAPDNTYDGDKDYTAVYAKTANRVMKFRVSVPEQQWGVPGFVYTDKAAYQHKVYEYKIPLSQIGLSADRNGVVELAFEAYGTAAPPPPPPPPLPQPTPPPTPPGDGGPPIALFGLGSTDIVTCPTNVSTLQFANTSLTCPPPGFGVRLMDPALGSYPDGKTAWGFQGPGDTNVGVFFFDNSTPPNPVKPPVSFPVTICLKYPTLAQMPPYGWSIQFWNGGAWVTQPTSAPAPVKLVNGADGFEVCTTIPPGGP